MGSLQYEFRECTNPNCRFRYPAPTQTKPDRICPRCGSAEQVVLGATFEPENNPEPRISDSTNNSASLIFLAALLDNIRSTWNVGSMLRTADGAGIRHIYLCGISPTPEHPHVSRTALGAERSVPWTWHPNSIDLAQTLVESGYKLWALETAPGAVSIDHAPVIEVNERVVLVVGNEIAGVDPALLDFCQQSISIPMRGVKRSLNAAVSFGIAAYTLLDRPDS